MNIVLLDPSLGDHENRDPSNLGDIIIYEAVSRVLGELFPVATFYRLSTHDYLEKQHYKYLNESDFIFIGGTNILSSNVRVYNQWKISKRRLYYLRPNIKKVILFGVGWWQYQNDPNIITRYFYSRILNKEKMHSIRDSYTKKMLDKIGIKNVINTCCPTTWDLNDIDPNRKDCGCNNCLFTLTDYKPDRKLDLELIEFILKFFEGKIYFFPQGSKDLDYLNSLSIYQANKNRIIVLEHSIKALEKCISLRNVCYIGTRLHCGTKCLQNGLDSIILSIDNRADTIGKDIGLPVVNRDDFAKLKKWLKGAKIFSQIRLPIENILIWKKQFLENEIF